MKKIIILIIVVILGLLAIFFIITNKEKLTVNKVEVNSFEECVSAGYPVMESYPRQCSTPKGELFVESVVDKLRESEFITVDFPQANDEIESPLTVSGQAKGNWFFEGDFPVVLTDWDGLIIAEGIARAQGAWMTDDFVPFDVILEFEKPSYNNKGTLILKRDNPSGLLENEEALEIPIIFK